MFKKESLINSLGYVFGAIGGYIYFLVFPCETGCAIRSNVFFNLLMGALIGDLVYQLVRKIVTQKK